MSSTVHNIDIKLYISHEDSRKNHGLQAIDLFCYGVAKKYEQNDEQYFPLLFF